MGKSKSKGKPSPTRLWVAPAWWQNQPGEPIAPERINDDEHPLTAAWRREQITQDQYIAGLTYRVLHEKLHRSGRDSTQAMGIGGGGGGEHFTEQQEAAGRSLEQIHEALGRNDAGIVRKFCGEGHRMSKAVLAFVPYPRNSVKHRLHEALNALGAVLDQKRIRRAA